MKKLGVFAVVLALTGMASAEVIVPGTPEMVLTVQLDGSATITNISGAPLTTDGYEIWSAAGSLDPVGWTSIQDAAAADPMGVLMALSSTALSFGEFTATPSLLAEGTLTAGAGAIFQNAAPWAIGVPVGTVAVGDLSFYYSKPTSPGDKFTGVVDIVPEPATMSLLVLGGLGLLARRRR